MSFFWSTSYTPTKEVPPPPKPVEPEVVVEKTEPEPYVSSRSVPTADAFKSVQITHTPKKRGVQLTVQVVKPVSVSDACTPVQSPYDMPEVETEFTFDNVEEVVTPSVDNERSDDLYNFQKRVHHLENLFNRGLYQHLKVVHQGVYKDSVLNGGFVAGPDRDELDVRENVHLYNSNSDVAGRLLELQHKYADLVAQNRQFSERLEQLTNQLADLSLDTGAFPH